MLSFYGMCLTLVVVVAMVTIVSTIGTGKSRL